MIRIVPTRLRCLDENVQVQEHHYTPQINYVQASNPEGFIYIDVSKGGRRSYGFDIK